MWIFKNVINFLFYLYDHLRAPNLSVKIEHFKLDGKLNEFLVIYRLGRQKLLNKMRLIEFEKNYFGNLTYFDLHRLAKFSLLQDLLRQLFLHRYCRADEFFTYIQEAIKYDDLF